MKKSRRYPKDVYRVDALLSGAYGDPRLGNKANPLDELIYILLSVRTQGVVFERAYRAYRRRFPQHELARRARVSTIASVIQEAGLADQRARSIKRALNAIYEQLGETSLRQLRVWSDDEVEHFLIGLPSVGIKVARCIMMYSLDRQVFPVDTHAWRICRRLGWVRASNSHGTCSNKDMNRLQGKIPPDLRYSLHVNMVAFGRGICLAKKPKCDICPIRGSCKRVGVKCLK